MWVANRFNFLREINQEGAEQTWALSFKSTMFSQTEKKNKLTKTYVDNFFVISITIFFFFNIVYFLKPWFNRNIAISAYGGISPLNTVCAAALKCAVLFHVIEHLYTWIQIFSDNVSWSPQVFQMTYKMLSLIHWKSCETDLKKKTYHTHSLRETNDNIILNLKARKEDVIFLNGFARCLGVSWLSSTNGYQSNINEFLNLLSNHWIL